MKNVDEMTKKELLEIENFMPTVDFNAIVIVPTKYKHDSGYRCMKFILCDGLKIVGAVSGCSDVVHINGIGGYGLSFDGQIKGYDWSIDCLFKSSCVRLFSSEKLTLGDYSIPFSSFEFYVTE